MIIIPVSSKQKITLKLCSGVWWGHGNGETLGFKQIANIVKIFYPVQDVVNCAKHGPVVYVFSHLAHKRKITMYTSKRSGKTDIAYLCSVELLDIKIFFALWTI